MCVKKISCSIMVSQPCYLCLPHPSTGPSSPSHLPMKMYIRACVPYLAVWKTLKISENCWPSFQNISWMILGWPLGMGHMVTLLLHNMEKRSYFAVTRIFNSLSIFAEYCMKIHTVCLQSLDLLLVLFLWISVEEYYSRFKCKETVHHSRQGRSKWQTNRS